LAPDLAPRARSMDCSLSALLRGCLKERTSNRVALLIESFPRPHHPIVEFAQLLYLLRRANAKATFVVDWQEIRERGLSSSVAEMMKLLRHNEHEVAIKFKPNLCNETNLNQHAVEALHFLQRVYGVTVVSAKVGRSLAVNYKAFESLGVTIVDHTPSQVVLQDTEDVLVDLAMALHTMGERRCVCVREMAR